MSLAEHIEANRIISGGPPTRAVLMAAIRLTHGPDHEKLKQAFPDLAEECEARRDSADGRISSDSDADRRAVGESPV